MTRPAPESAPRRHETTELHSRLLKCGLAIDESRAYWAHATGGAHAVADQAFEQYWFGAKSLPRVKELLLHLDARFAAFPDALAVLRGWHSMTADTRALICHWHVQLTDPLYRSFSGDFLVSRRARGNPSLHRHTVVTWVAERGREHWTLATRKELASRLLTASRAAGLVSGRRDPRTLIVPRPRDEALAYVLHLLRATSFAGTMLDNPYLRSVGLDGAELDRRLGRLRCLDFRRGGDVVQFGWRHPGLTAWADAELGGCGVAS